MRALSSPQEIQALVPAGGVGACLSHAAHASSPQPRLTVVVVVGVAIWWRQNSAKATCSASVCASW